MTETTAPAETRVITSWGMAVEDPRHALDVLEGTPEFQAALYDAGHPSHSLAVKQRAELYDRAYPTEPPQAQPYAGNVPDEVGKLAFGADYHNPTEQEMRAHEAGTMSGWLQREGFDPDTASELATAASVAGLTPLEVGDLIRGITGSRLYRDPEPGSNKPTKVEQVYAELGPDAAKIIAAAQQEALRVGLSAELLETIAVGGLSLGDHPALIKLLAARAGARS